MHFFIFSGVGFVLFIIGLSFNAHLRNGENSTNKNHVKNDKGSRNPNDLFLKLSPAETKKRLRMLAEKIDADKDGYVNFAELLQHINETLLKLDAEESDDQFEAADANSDGYVTWQEHKEFEKRQYEDEDDDDDDDDDDDEDEGDEKEKEKKEEEIVDPVEDKEDFLFFQTADENKDGKLSRGEYEAIKNPEKHQRMHSALVESTLQEKDKNNDGFLDFDEFEQEKATNEKESELQDTEILRFKEIYDKNGDGKLDRDELRLWLIPDLSESAELETKHLMSEADKNKDGKLSYKEIIMEYSLFAQSEATNYGDQLEELVHEEL